MSARGSSEGYTRRCGKTRPVLGRGWEWRKELHLHKSTGLFVPMAVSEMQFKCLSCCGEVLSPKQKENISMERLKK